ncbi:MAG: hypothetical protein MSG64_00710 [Pyrinomonadaceae bacterium MAG19_C2-C3]|nr:hypothetical protein [Pyrinomonadaceae bacterium MAG19_C2-C3]
MTIFQAIILGIVQGLTEFIPISSSAHLIFASRALALFAGVDDATRAERITATIAVTQLGTLVAVFVYFARDIWVIGNAFIRDHFALIGIGAHRGESVDAMTTSNHTHKLSHEARLGWLVIIGSLPVGIVGLLFKDVIEGTFTKNLWVISIWMILIALFLLVAERVGSRTRTIETLGVRDAMWVGWAQVLALIPGASRSGSTIMGGLFAGQTRETAARFSFLLSIPAIAASGLLELAEIIKEGALPPESFVPLLVSVIVSGIVGYASIWFLLSYLRRHSTVVFIGYRVILGVVILGLLSAGVITAN